MTAKNSHRVVAGEKHKGAEKVARIPVKVQQPAERLRKPTWIRAKSPFHPNVKKLKSVLREQKLNTVCEEAACPNLG
ncbi:MAG TPA: lipoyl synthase, partial [Thiotrichales bacterium]|nr:lipoyl synthase [Thiotrichales bacterium]